MIAVTFQNVHYTEVSIIERCPLCRGVIPTKNRSVGPRSVHYTGVSTIERFPLWEVLLYIYAFIVDLCSSMSFNEMDGWRRWQKYYVNELTFRKNEKSCKALVLAVSRYFWKRTVRRTSWILNLTISSCLIFMKVHLHYIYYYFNIWSLFAASFNIVLLPLD